MQALWTTLPPYADYVHGRRRVDVHLVLFGLNLVLVPLGYYFTITYNALALIKAARIVLMGASLLWLMVQWRKSRYPIRGRRHAILGAFMLANLAVMPFSVLPDLSLERFLTVAPFWIYTDVFAAYLRGRYGPQDGLRRLMWALLLVYLFPVLVFYASGNPFAKLSIYGDDSRGFVSNQFGWATALALGCLVDVWKYLGTGWWKRPLWFAVAGGCLWLLLISGSRSGYLSLGAVLLVLFLAGRNIGLLPRLGIVLGAVLAVLYLVDNTESAVNQRLRKSESQLETVEPRLLSARQAFHALDTHEERYITGVGFDLYGEAIWRITNVYPRKAHNSYLELFVNCGAIVSLIFLLGLVVPALFRYLRYDAGDFAFVPPILIIPYFENNLGAGQFLFYPWMFLFFWYLHDTRWGSREQEPLSTD